MVVDNEQVRIKWVENQLSALPANTSILDVGAGECQYKKYCSHLIYTAQDVSEYDGKGNSAGLQTGSWDFSQIDITCDVLDIPESTLYDTILCTEVLEHVSDPVRVIEKLIRLCMPTGTLIITAPFSSLTHFAPYHYATGFSSFFYSYHLERNGCDLIEMTPNGGYFDYLAQEIHRTPHVYKKFTKSKFNLIEKFILKKSKRILERAAAVDRELEKSSSELLTFGWHVVARKR